MPFQFEKTHIPEVILIKPKSFKDDRGSFLETYKFSDFNKEGIDFLFMQDNQSYSTKNVIRGIHFQKSPKQQVKIVRCIRGKIFDVAVDLRPSSPTFKKWFGCELSEDNKHMLYIPEGFGHGFAVTSKDAIVVYKCSNEYNPDLDGGIRYDDPDIGINWHIKSPKISPKDENLPYLKNILAEIG